MTQELERMRLQHRQRLIGVIVLALVAVVTVPWLMAQSKAPKSLVVASTEASLAPIPADSSSLVISSPSNVEQKLSATALMSSSSDAMKPRLSPVVEPLPKDVAPSPVAVLPEAKGSVNASEQAKEDGRRRHVTSTKLNLSMRAVKPDATSASKIVTEEPVDLSSAASVQANDKGNVESKDQLKPGQWIQVGVFAHHDRVLLLDKKLHKLGLSSQIESFVTSEGGVRWRVRVGPFASVDSCHQALHRLASLGVKGMVVPQ